MSKAAIEKYLTNVSKDMYSQNPKVPIESFRIESTNIDGQLFTPDWFKYMIYGRGPGKQPPPQRMIDWVKRTPDIVARLKQSFKYITEKGAAYIIGRKIGREGTRIWRGEVKGVDLLGAMEKNLPQLKEDIAKEEVLKITTSLKRAIQSVPVKQFA